MSAKLKYEALKALLQEQGVPTEKAVREAIIADSKMRVETPIEIVRKIAKIERLTQVKATDNAQEASAKMDTLQEAERKGFEYRDKAISVLQPAIYGVLLATREMEGVHLSKLDDADKEHHVHNTAWCLVRYWTRNPDKPIELNATFIRLMMRNSVREIECGRLSRKNRGQ